MHGDQRFKFFFFGQQRTETALFAPPPRRRVAVDEPPKLQLTQVNTNPRRKYLRGPRFRLPPCGGALSRTRPALLTKRSPGPRAIRGAAASHHLSPSRLSAVRFSSPAAGDSATHLPHTATRAAATPSPSLARADRMTPPGKMENAERLVPYVRVIQVFRIG